MLLQRPEGRIPEKRVAHPSGSPSAASGPGAERIANRPPSRPHDMPWHPGAGAGCSEQRPGRTVALGYIHTYILGGRYRDAVGQTTAQPNGGRWQVH